MISVAMRHINCRSSLLPSCSVRSPYLSSVVLFIVNQAFVRRFLTFTMVSLLRRPVLRVFGTIVIAAVSVVASGSTIVMNGITYYASPDIVTTIAATPAELKQCGDDEWVPLTVMENPTGAFTASVLQSVVKSYIAVDDVFSTGFLQGKLLNLLYMSQILTTMSQSSTSSTIAVLLPILWLRWTQHLLNMEQKSSWRRFPRAVPLPSLLVPTSYQH